MMGNLISASNKEEAGGRGIERGMAAAANYCDQPPLGEQIASQTAIGADWAVQTAVAGL